MIQTLYLYRGRQIDPWIGIESMETNPTMHAKLVRDKVFGDY